jgi:hypothetical protein
MKNPIEPIEEKDEAPKVKPTKPQTVGGVIHRMRPDFRDECGNLPRGARLDEFAAFAREGRKNGGVKMWVNDLVSGRRYLLCSGFALICGHIFLRLHRGSYITTLACGHSEPLG